MHLNGWRRLAIALCVMWSFGAVAWTSFEALAHRDGIFVGRTLPVGAVIVENKVTLPGGRVVELNTVPEGKTVNPWEIKWDAEPELTTERYVRWEKLLGLGLLFPFASWIAIELIALLANWIARGFRANRS